MRTAPPRALFDRFFGRRSEPAAEAPASPSSPEEDAVTRSLRPLLDGTVLEGEALLLAFDANRDGWTAAAFHKMVDNRGPTLLVARSAGGSRFGGFNPLGFASREDYRDTSNAFLFRWAAGDEWSSEPEYLQKVRRVALVVVCASVTLTCHVVLRLAHRPSSTLEHKDRVLAPTLSRFPFL